MPDDIDRRLLTRIALRNYKSIAACEVWPTRLSFLVGPNGSGKSNFLDALSFVADSLRFSLDHALRDRGGINEVRRRFEGHPSPFGIGLHIQLPDSVGSYAFEVRADSRTGYKIQREECTITCRGEDPGTHYYCVQDGRVVKSSLEVPPASASDRLYLVTVSGLPEFRQLYEALAGMSFHNFDPAEIRELQNVDPGNLLKKDGSNLAGVLANLITAPDDRMKRILEYLAEVVPGVVDVRPIRVGSGDTIQFSQTIPGAEQPEQFLASNMSDGTLRALAVLVSLFRGNGQHHHRLVGIEEPEIALHPVAAGILIDALQDASESSQILVTCHSSDLLDDDAITDQSILAVESDDGETRIGPLDEAGRTALRDHLYTAGELLRMNQLCPDPELSKPKQLDLFQRES